MSATDRSNLLKELFAATGSNIGIGYLRVSIGASDSAKMFIPTMICLSDKRTPC